MRGIAQRNEIEHADIASPRRHLGMFKDERVLEGLKTETYTATAILRYSPVAPSPGVFLVRIARRSI
jgi:hypothetical protein